MDYEKLGLTLEMRLCVLRNQNAFLKPESILESNLEQTNAMEKLSMCRMHTHRMVKNKSTFRRWTISTGIVQIICEHLSKIQAYLDGAYKSIK